MKTVRTITYVFKGKFTNLQPRSRKSWDALLKTEAQSIVSSDSVIPWGKKNAVIALGVIAKNHTPELNLVYRGGGEATLFETMNIKASLAGRV